MITGYSVLIEDDGTPTVRLEVPHGFEAPRQPTMRDLRRSILEIASDLNSRAVADYVVERLNPPQETTADRVAAAMKRSQEES